MDAKRVAVNAAKEAARELWPKAKEEIRRGWRLFRRHYEDVREEKRDSKENQENHYEQADTARP